MKRNLWTLLIIALLGSLLSSPGSANAENAVNFQLTTSGVTDNKVLLSMIGNNMVDLYSYEARFTFDPNHLELVGTSSNLGGFSISPKVQGNEIVIAHTKVGDVPGKSGDFAIGTLTFRLKKPGQSTVVWTAIKAVNHNLDYQMYSPKQSVSVLSTNTETAPNVQGPVNVSKEEFNAIINDVVEIADGQQHVLLPAKAAEMIISNKLELRSKDFSFFIPKEVLKGLQDLLAIDELENARISFKFNSVSEEVKHDLLKNASSKAKAKVTANGEIIEYSLSVISAKGSEQILTKFNKPITLKLKINNHAQPSLLGLYLVTNSDELECIGGKIADGYLTADVSKLGKYAVLAFDKSFEDVAGTHWAAPAIKELVAKHIVYGVNDTHFLPNANVTRAEFAAFVVRALGLQATGDVSFTDVNNKAWYASIVTAAKESGIIKGRSETIFAPNDRISREEMASIMVRAYEFKSGFKATAGQQDPLADTTEVSAWAKDDVLAAVKLGIISGRGDGQLAPQAWSTRAEAAQIIVNLLRHFA